MKVLIACEFSGIVREAFGNKGHDAWSCDLLPTEKPGQHYKGRFEDLLNLYLWNSWDMIIAFPPCTYLTVTGNKWFKPEFKKRFPKREHQREEAINFFMLFFSLNVPKICVENPIGIMSTRYRKPDQIIQPYQFGEPERKSTCLWLKGLSKLEPTKIVEPNLYTYKDGRTDGMWHVKTMKLKPHERMKARSKTFQGIADAMAEQWG